MESVGPNTLIHRELGRILKVAETATQRLDCYYIVVSIVYMNDKVVYNR